VLFEGICAQEIHLCGEESGIEFIREMAMVTGDDMEVRKYKRLTSLTVLNKAVGMLFIICISRSLSLRGFRPSLLYTEACTYIMIV